MRRNMASESRFRQFCRQHMERITRSKSVMGDRIRNVAKETTVEKDEGSSSGDKTIAVVNDTEIKTNPDTKVVELNRELKSILELSKEAKMDTNILHKRKSVQKLDSKRRYSTGSSLENESSESPVNTPKNLPLKKKKDLQETSPDGATGSSDKKKKRSLVLTTEMNKDGKDAFCWRCHREDVNISCETCPRSYHQKCLKQSIANPNRWPCPECVAILKAESTKTRSPALKEMTLEHLCGLLKFALKRMMQCTGSEPFIHPVSEDEFPEYKSYIVQPMDLTMLEKNIKNNLYGSTQAFEADAKWLLHNSIIFNSYQSKLTSVAKYIVKICKQEMAEIENCSSCYLNANTKTNSWFVEVCPKPHILLWAKLKSFPYWPAKAMCTNSLGMVDVRFFGAHDRAWVPHTECFLYSQRDPNSNKQKRHDINECIKELDVHISNLQKVYGRFRYAPYRTQFDPEQELKQLQMFLPDYEPNSPSNMKMYVKKRRSVSGSKAPDAASNSVQTDDKIMVGYGTDDDETEEEINKTRRQEIMNETTGDAVDMETDDTNVETPATEVTFKGLRSKTCTSAPETHKRPLADDSAGVSQKKARRNSASSAKSDSSRRSNVSEKITKVNVSKNMEVSVSNDPVISDNSETSDAELKKKPIVQVEVENRELMISPQSKSKISDRLIRKLSEVEPPVKRQILPEAQTDPLAENPKLITVNEAESDEITIKDHFADEEEEFSEDTDRVLENTQMNEELIRNIIHSSLNEMPLTKSKDPKTYSSRNEKPKEANIETQTGAKNAVQDTSAKRKSVTCDVTSVDESFPNKLKKLVSENVGSAKKTQATNKQQSILLKQLQSPQSQQNQPKPPLKSTPFLEIKSEPCSEDEEQQETTPEAKKELFTALKISEKLPDVSSTKVTNSVKVTVAKPVDNLAETIDSVAKATDETSKRREIYLKPIAKLVRQRARKSFPTPQPLVKPPKEVSGAQPVLKTNITTTNMVIVTQTQPVIINSQLSQPVNYVTTGGVTPFVTLSPYAGIVVPQVNANSPVLVPAAPPPSVAEESQNYIPPNGQLGKPLPNTALSTSTETALKNILDDIPSLVPILSSSAPGGNKNVSVNVSVNPESVRQDFNDLGVLKSVLSEPLTKALMELTSRPPPKLKPRPPSALGSFEEAVPSSVGPVTSKLNTVSHRLADYFRGVLVETLSDFGENNANAEARITTLKLELETLKHKHSVELLEIKKNVYSIVKDMQRNNIEEREKIVQDTRAQCEAEVIKRVEEAKSRQWCANCLKEAQFYCCWNTSYCDYPCQQKHWPKHMSKCAQNATGSSSTPPNIPKAPPVVVRPFAGKTLIAKPSKVIINRPGGNAKAQAPQIVRNTNGSHITLVESSPGNYEFVGNGPISIGGKIIANTTSVVSRVAKSAAVTVTSPSVGVQQRVVAKSGSKVSGLFEVSD